MIHFDLESLPVYLDEMHKIEHEADLKKHDLLNTLAKAFITPIEQEDIMQISRNLDDLTDKIEDVLIRIYYKMCIRDRFLSWCVWCCKPFSMAGG